MESSNEIERRRAASNLDIERETGKDTQASKEETSKKDPQREMETINR